MHHGQSEACRRDAELDVVLEAAKVAISDTVKAEGAPVETPGRGWTGAHATCPAGGHAAGCQPLMPPVEPEENAVPAAQDLTEAGSAGQLSCGTPEEGVGPAASAYEAAIDDSFIPFAQANRTGSSGNTCQHLIAYLHAAKSKVVILENVPEMAT